MATGLQPHGTQRPQLPASQWVSRWHTVLCSGDRERCSGEINLGPLQVANLGSPQPVPERQQDHGLVSVRPAIVLAASNQLLDLALGQVLAGADVGIFGPARRNFPFYGVW